LCVRERKRSWSREACATNLKIVAEPLAQGDNARRVVVERRDGALDQLIASDVHHHVGDVDGRAAGGREEEEIAGEKGRGIGHVLALAEHGVGVTRKQDAVRLVDRAHQACEIIFVSVGVKLSSAPSHQRTTGHVPEQSTPVRIALLFHRSLTKAERPPQK
jgi:hypothetical protein